mgnify:CR=1 FL=1
MFLSKEESFNDERIFDVVALTLQTLPLEVWYEINLNKRARGEMIQLSYKCYLYVTDVLLDQLNDENFESLLEESTKKKLVLSNLLNLSKVLTVTLLSEKKDSPEPILNILKRLSRLLITLIINIHP